MVFRYFLFATVFILALSFVRPTHAHGGEPRLEISAEGMNPGGVVEIRGVDFEPEELITLALIGHEFEFPLGEIVADTDGIFLQIVTLPTDLAEGAYKFRAITDDHEITSPTLTVFGTAISEAGGEGPREEDDGLLAPMPTFAPAVVTAPVAAVPVEATPASASNRNIPALIVLMVIGIAIVAIVFTIKRKNTQ